MEAQDHPDARVADILRNEGMHRAVGAQSKHVGQNPDHVPKPGERLCHELLKTNAVIFRAGEHVAVITLDICRREARDLLPGPDRVAAVVEMAAVVETDTVEGGHRAKLDGPGEGLSTERPEFVQQKRRGDDGWARIKTKAILFVHSGPPTGTIQFLQHGDTVAPFAQPYRRGQAAEAAADDHGVGFQRRMHRLVERKVGTVHLVGRSKLSTYYTIAPPGRNE